MSRFLLNIQFRLNWLRVVENACLKHSYPVFIRIKTKYEFFIQVLWVFGEKMILFKVCGVWVGQHMQLECHFILPNCPSNWANTFVLPKLILHIHVL